jgi:predicted transglutaminase-like cysteine proteinase
MQGEGGMPLGNEFCATNGFAYFCRNKSEACGRQRQNELQHMIK